MVRKKNGDGVDIATFEQKKSLQTSSSLQMNFFEDAFRYFSQLNKEASAKHILIKVYFLVSSGQLCLPSLYMTARLPWSFGTNSITLLMYVLN